MEVELGVQITRPVGDLTFASTETDAVFVLFAHLPGFIKDEIEVELNEAGTEISISSRGETGERSFIEAEISGRLKISHEESLEGFRKAFPIPNNVVLGRIEVGFEEEEGILIVLLPKSTREEEPSRVEIEEISEENIREEEEEEEERTWMTVELEETIPDYNKEKAQEQKNLGEVEPKKSTEKLDGKPDGKPEAGPREATTKIAIEDKEDRESELIIEELDFPITPSISEEPIAFKSEEEEEEEEEENTLEEEAPEQMNLDELELSKSSKPLESEPEGETEPESKEIAIRTRTDDKEIETELIREEPDFTMTPPPLEKPIVSEAFEAEEEEE
ncbi:histone acetyltransferase KAT6B-like, partial [Ananas comosus]|uniref:Histone acetyltransferase KAT6B-like n=1 Tax=Ananas comosus TaxID=4615 RepID=A0A6P5GGY8_ANACO